LHVIDIKTRRIHPTPIGENQADTDNISSQTLGGGIQKDGVPFITGGGTHEIGNRKGVTIYDVVTDNRSCSGCGANRHLDRLILQGVDIQEDISLTRHGLRGRIGIGQGYTAGPAIDVSEK